MTTYRIARNVTAPCNDLAIRAINWLCKRGAYSVSMSCEQKDAVMVDLVNEFGAEVLDVITSDRDF